MIMLVKQYRPLGSQSLGSQPRLAKLYHTIGSLNMISQGSHSLGTRTHVLAYADTRPHKCTHAHYANSHRKSPRQQRRARQRNKTNTHINKQHKNAQINNQNHNYKCCEMLVPSETVSAHSTIYFTFQHVNINFYIAEHLRYIHLTFM